MIDAIVANAKIVTPTEIVHGSIAIDRGRIEMVGPHFLMPKSRQVIDAQERYVIPGLVDPHVHYGLVGDSTFVEHCKRDWKPDSVGAAFGGVTTVMPMMMGYESHIPLVRELIGWGDENSAVDYAFTVIIHQDGHLNDMAPLFEMGITAFKHFFTAFKGAEGRKLTALNGVDEGYFYRSLERIRDLGAPAIAMCHAEDCELYGIFTQRERAKGRNGLKAWADARPPFTEAVRIEMASRLAYEANAPLYFVHLSTHESIEVVQKYKHIGTRLAAEAVIHTLTVSCDDEDEVGVWGKFVPPLRPKREIDAMWRGITAGVFDTIATDHCTYTLEDKTQGEDKFGSVWDALPGVSNVQEHWLPVLWTYGVKTGRITVHDVVKLCAENAARRFGLYPRKGAISPGADADLLIVDDTTEHLVDENFYHGRDRRLTIYKGRQLVGRPKLTMLRGKIIMQDGKFLGAHGDGRFTPARLGEFSHAASKKTTEAASTAAAR